jgi:hypothetical protein
MSLREMRGFSGCELSHFKVDGWTREEIGQFILFYQVDPCVSKEGGVGFECVAVEWSAECNNVVYYDEVLRATAYWDGVRHLHFRQGGDEGIEFNGYDYYPDMKSYQILFQRLRELELEYCWSANK